MCRTMLPGGSTGLSAIQRTLVIARYVRSNCLRSSVGGKATSLLDMYCTLLSSILQEEDGNTSQNFTYNLIYYG